MGFKNLKDNIEDVVSNFDIQGTIKNKRQIQNGNINRTYLIEIKIDNNNICEEKKYIFQRVNTYVFAHPKEVMENIFAVTNHIKDKFTEMYGDCSRRTLVYLPTYSGHYYLDSKELGFWRAYEFIDNVTAYDSIQDPHHFYEAGKAFGEFQRVLADFPAETLYETIPNFHNTPKRIEAFKEAVANDVAGRKHLVEDEIDFILNHEDESGVITNLIQEGIIPLRVAHNDTKLNNVLIDNTTGKGICVIDLDTVMPGTSIFDFGDAIRYGANKVTEDNENYDQVGVDMDLYKRFTKGFIESTRGFLKNEELDLLPLGAVIITLELATRFLTDYLNGDVYFKVVKENHNLIRARNQIALVKDMEANFDTMQHITNKYTYADKYAEMKNK